MANPGPHPLKNHILEGAPGDDVVPLEVMIGKDDQGRAYMESQWEMSEDEIKAIQTSGVVRLQVWGRHPPVCIYVPGVEYPEEDDV